MADLSREPSRKKQTEKDIAAFLGEVFERDLKVQEQDMEQERAYYNELNVPVPLDENNIPLVEGLTAVHTGLYRLNVDDLGAIFVQEDPYLEIREPGTTPQQLAVDAGEQEIALNELIKQIRRQHEDPWPKIAKDIWPYNRIVSQVLYVPAFWNDHPQMEEGDTSESYMPKVQKYRRQSYLAGSGADYRLPIIWRYVFPPQFFPGTKDYWGLPEGCEIQQETVRTVLNRYGANSKFKRWVADHNLEMKDKLTFFRYENRCYRVYGVMQGMPFSQDEDFRLSLSAGRDPDVIILSQEMHGYDMPSYIYDETTTGHPDPAKNLQGPMTDLPEIQLHVDAALTQQKFVVTTGAYPFIFHKNGRPGFDEQGKPRAPKKLRPMVPIELEQENEDYEFRSVPGVMTEFDLYMRNLTGLWERKTLSPESTGQGISGNTTGYRYAQQWVASMIGGRVKAIALKHHFEKVGQMIEKVAERDIIKEEGLPGLPVYANYNGTLKWFELNMKHLQGFHAMSAVIKMSLATDKAGMWDLVMRVTNAPNQPMSIGSALQEIADYPTPYEEESLVRQEHLRKNMEPIQMEWLQQMYQMKMGPAVGSPSPNEQTIVGNAAQLAAAGQNGVASGLAGVPGQQNTAAQQVPPGGRPANATQVGPRGGAGGQPVGVTRLPGGPNRGAGGGPNIP